MTKTHHRHPTRNRPDRVLVARVDGDSSELLGAAALLWVALGTPTTLDALADELAEFGVDRELLVTTIGQLREAGLVVAVGPPQHH